MRLDKCLADCGLGTRSEVKSLLKAKRITVNGKVVNNGKVQVNPETDEICLMARRFNTKSSSIL